MAQAGTDLQNLAAKLLDQAKRNENAANALMDLAWVFSIAGEETTALSTQALALELQQLYHLPPAISEPGLRLLALMTPGEYMFNAPLECLLEGSDVALDLLFLGPDLPFPDQLPEHDLVFTAIREADENLPLLRDLEKRLVHHAVPVLNAPARIPLLARDQASTLLSMAPGLFMPQTTRVAREDLTSFLLKRSFPLLVRAVGAHRGLDLMKLEAPADIPACLGAMSALEFYVAEFVDYRSPDGQFRKARVVLIEGRPYAAHLAISDHWMVNFVNSQPELSPAKRTEEAIFLAHFEDDFAARHATALATIHERLQLDYVVLDCAEAPDGRLLVFEADSSAIVHANDPVDLYPHKQSQMRKVFQAFRDMLGRAAGLTPGKASHPGQPSA
jgi:glutathione synthase/RimK-type ligase-like ATP-grasp enzyme